MNQRKILVVGSLNADLVQNIQRVPNPGETIEGSELRMFCGGEGREPGVCRCAAGRRRQHDRDGRNAAPTLLQKGPGSVIIKMGGLSCLAATESISVEIAGHSVEAVDTTGAEDPFNGALAVALSEGVDLVEAACFANGAAACSVALPGTIDSMPTRAALTRFLEDRSAATKVG